MPLNKNFFASTIACRDEQVAYEVGKTLAIMLRLTKNPPLNIPADFLNNNLERFMEGWKDGKIGSIPNELSLSFEGLGSSYRKPED